MNGTIMFVSEIIMLAIFEAANRGLFSLQHVEETSAAFDSMRTYRHGIMEIHTRRPLAPLPGKQAGVFACRGCRFGCILSFSILWIINFS